MNWILHLMFSVLLASCNMPSQTTTNQQETNNNINFQELTLAPKEVCELPKKIDESSGLEYDNGLFYTINDSGGKAEVYVLSEEGEMVDELKFPNVENDDWEDIAAVGEAILVGDFGNNLGSRKNLEVFVWAHGEVSELPFSFADQTNFSDQNHNTAYDCEALFSIGDEVFVLTKDWKNLTTSLYQLPIETEQKQIELLGTANVDLLITGADYLPEQQLLVASGYINNDNYILLFPKFNAQQPFQENWIKIELKDLHNAQVEGVAVSQSEIYFSTEETKDFDPQIWKLELADLNKYLKN